MGYPSKGTPADRRLSENQGKPKGGGSKSSAPTPPAHPRPVIRRGKRT